MNALTDEQKIELRSCPPWFLDKLKEAIAAKKDLEAKILAEQEREEKLKVLVADWKVQQKIELESATQSLEARLAEAEQEQSGYQLEESKRGNLQLQMIESQLAKKVDELEQARVIASQRNEQIRRIKQNIITANQNIERKQGILNGTIKDEPETIATVTSPLMEQMQVRERSSTISSLNVTNLALPTAKPNTINLPENADTIESIDLECLIPQNMYDCLLEVCHTPCSASHLSYFWILHTAFCRLLSTL